MTKQTVIVVTGALRVKKKMYCRLEFGHGTDYLLHQNETYCKNYLSSILIFSLDPYSGENMPLSMCVNQIRV